MSNYLKLVPIETYQKILLHLDPKNLKILCLTDKYAEKLCQDNYFNYQYIKFNYDSYEYGYSSWIYNKNLDWKAIFNKVSSERKLLRITQKGIILDKEIILDKLVALHKNDKVSDFINRIIRLFTLFIKKSITDIQIKGNNNIEIVYEYEDRSYMYEPPASSLVLKYPYNSNNMVTTKIIYLDSEIILGTYKIDSMLPNSLFDNLNSIIIIWEDDRFDDDIYFYPNKNI